MPFGPSLYQQHRHHRASPGSSSEVQNLGSHPRPRAPTGGMGQLSTRLRKPALRQWQGGQGKCALRAHLPRLCPGVQGPRRRDRGLRILKKLLKEASQWFWGNFLGKNPSFRKVLIKIFNTFPIIVNKPYPHYLSNLFHTTGGAATLEKCVITFSYLIISDRLIYRISLLKRIKMTLHSCFLKQLPPF